jgi:hypothetical protein
MRYHVDLSFDAHALALIRHPKPRGDFDKF